MNRKKKQPTKKQPAHDPNDPLAPYRTMLNKAVARAEREALEAQARLIALQSIAVGMSKGRDHLVSLLTDFLTPTQIEGLLSVCVSVHEEIMLKKLSTKLDSIKTSRRLLQFLDKEKLEQLDALFELTGVIPVAVGHA